MLASSFSGSILQPIYPFDDIDGLFTRSWKEVMDLPKEAFKTFQDICIANGFQVESHWVTTQDGYINLMFRVYKNETFIMVNDTRVNKPSVFMLHGIIDSADSFIINLPDKAPAFVAASAGYDVWIGNTRGNKYSRSHVKYDSNKDYEYWDHSFVEMAKYDVPAFIEHI
jgi:gastric triacylglycerol lipase